ncbi:two-component regulator propeller domain-containing protein [Mucilaginibacter sp.]|uniref:sensor histidine kinase n=1 Tax=Mucilaginibacter sp. TaxID=1882438 RepID=UPI00284C6B65|nr:two-component regulator propeller domain-containing protein [Mucilaginibacter sp.]MDR3697050.1 two-component regulator propeller domain-containing protein [Mucilaginibacter sp.]
MRLTGLFLVFLVVAIACEAQPEKYTAFTVDDGLPSNYVYRCIEDNKGFLWVATDAGIARFDGKHFQVFTTREGLPDNEVLAVVKENDGRIWVNCFKQSPAYFDEIKNRFINAKEDSTLAKVKEGTGLMYCYPLQKGGVMFWNQEGSFIFRNKKLTAYPNGKKNDGFLIKENTDGSVLKLGGSISGETKLYRMVIYQVKEPRYTDSISLRERHPSEIINYSLSDGKLYYFNDAKGKCYIYSDFSTRPIRFHIDSVETPEPFNNFECTANYFYFSGISGKIYLFNKKNLQQEAVVGGNYLPNSVYKDSNGNLWISTIDKGLLVYKKKHFNDVELPSRIIGTNFLSIARKADGTILAGNFYGEVIAAKGKDVSVNAIPKKGLIARQRKIILSQNKMFTFSEAGIYVNNTRPLLNSLVSYAKTAITYNDSIIIVGQSHGLIKLNSITERLSVLKGLGKRITALARGGDGMVYFGSTDGLYQYNYARDSTIPINQISPLLSERVTALCTTPDGLLWVATSGSGLVVVKNDKVLLHISETEGIINNASRSVTNGKPGQVWLGTAGGISVLNYTLINDSINFSVQNLTVNDGLNNNVINEILYQKDSVYVATGEGISIIPANVSIPEFNIPVQLIRMRINQRDTIIAPHYHLRNDQQNLQMQFAGIELGGHFKNLQYTLNKNKNWINFDENTLTIELGSGSHLIQVRAVDVNGNISNKILAIKFDIATPFWKAIWFWLFTALILQLVVIYWLNRRIKSRKEAKLAKQIAGVQIASLEQQAFTSLMNPHFMFNALNSIQHYINLQDRQNANRYLSDFASLIRKNFEAAQQSFVPLEQEVENIKIYLRLEQMRFNNHFSYQLSIDENLDVEEWMIPTMILQPLLENALLHGIMPSSIDGKVDIDLKEQEGNLMITITDNGIGIANSIALKTPDGHKSRGMELIKKRVAALSSFGASAITISMAPVFESKKNPGNKIILFVPQGLHRAWYLAQQQ